MGKVRKTVGVGVGIAALAAAATYFLGEDGEANREKVRGWALKFKGEVLERMEGLKDINKDSYHKVVDNVAKRYKRVKKASQPEIKKLQKDLKGAWKSIAKELKA